MSGKMEKSPGNSSKMYGKKSQYRYQYDIISPEQNNQNSTTTRKKAKLKMV